MNESSVGRKGMLAGMLAMVWVLAGGPAAWAYSGFIWPTSGTVTGLWGEDRGDHLHSGIDIANSSGTHLHAACQGTVIFAGWYSGYGNTIDIMHAGNWVTRYAHQSGFAVGVGANVVRGQHIGYMGSTGDSTGPHVHFEIRQGQTFGFTNSYNVPGSRGQWITGGTEVPATYSGSTCGPPIPNWDASYSAQSFPSSMEAGSTAIVWAEYRNTGSQYWHHGETYLGTSSPQDRNSPFCNTPNWANCTRPTEVDQWEVQTNQVGRFTFILKAPTAPGNYVEKYRLVREGVTWFGPEITWTINVTASVGNLTGTVTNASTAQPVTGAAVSLSGVGNTTTNASGVYNFNNVAAGSYTASVIATGYSPANANVSISSGSTTTRNFALTPSDLTPPSVPTNLVGQAQGPTTVALSWTASTDNVGVAGYDIRRDGTIVGSSTGPSYTDNAATSGTEHTYTVRAKDAVPNYSGWSGPAIVRTPFAPPQPTLLFSDGFNGGLGNWTQQTQNFDYSTAVSHGTYTGGGAAFVAAGQADQMFHAFARPFAQGKVWGYFWDGKGGWKATVCGWAYRQALSLRNMDGTVGMFIDNEFYSASDNAKYFFRTIGENGIAHTAYATRNPNTSCDGAWVYFQTTVTPGAVGASPPGTFVARVTDGAGTTNSTQSLTTNYFDYGIGRITLGLGTSSSNEGYWDDIGFEATSPAVPLLVEGDALSETEIQWHFTPADNNHFGFDMASGGGSILSPQWPAVGWLDRAATTWTETGLAANTAYTRKVRAWNGTLSSPYSWPATAHTLSVPPATGSITASAATVCPDEQVTWTAVGGFGAGKVAYYRYAWTHQSTHTFTGTEPVWNSGSLVLSDTIAGICYLHVQGYNAADVPNGTHRYEVDILVCDPPEVTIIAALSRKVHGSAGVHDLDLFSAGAVEPRQGGATQVVLTFSEPIQGAGGLDNNDVSLNSGAVDSLLIDGSGLTINLGGTADGAPLMIGFPGIVDAASGTGTIPTQVCVEVLAGDVTADRATNIFDLIAVRNVLNAPVGPANFMMDINADGSINIFDLISVRNNLNHTLTGDCP